MGFLSVLINPLILITSILLSLMIIYIFYAHYRPYFFPNLDENKDINQIIINDRTYKQKLLLIKGIISIDNNTPVIFNTTNINSNNYVKFYPSVNQDGGNQLSYSFWINKKNNNYMNRTLIHNGEENKPSPRISFGDNSRQLKIEFETRDKDGTNSRQAVIENQLLNITDHDNWYMITVVFKDYKDYKRNDFETGLELSVYLNDTLLDLKKYEDEILNLSELEFKVLPDAETSIPVSNVPGEMADIRYFNYALTHLDIVKLYNKGFNNEVFKTYFQLNKDITKQNIHKINMFNQLRLN